MKTKVFSSVLVCLCLSATLAIFGCGTNGGGSSSGSGGSGGSGGTGSGTAGAVSLNPQSAQAIDEGQKLTITASVASDAEGNGVTWKLSGSGALSGQSATSVTYTAGSSGTGTATISATAVDNTSQTASLTFTVNAPPAITTTSLPAAMERATL